MREKLLEKEIEYSEWVIKNHPEYILKWEKVMFFDPKPIYDRISHLINPYKRFQRIKMNIMFPDINGFCACGCGQKLEGNQRRWANQDCFNFAWEIHQVICGTRERPHKYIDKYSGHKCKCGETKHLELDHIVPVKHGGGGCWLSNYEWKCKKCHRDKTNVDFGFKRKTESNNEVAA